MADTGKALKKGASRPALPSPETGGFNFAGILAIADALPMPIAYLDEQQRYLFINKAFAEFFERPRSKILGLTVRELLGDEIYAVRKPLFDAAYAGERQWFAADFPHPTRGPLAIQAEYIPQVSPGRKGALGRRPGARCHRAEGGRAGASRKRGPVPQDREPGAGADVGDQARPDPRLRQRRLYGRSSAGAASMRRRSTGGRGSIPTTSTGSSQNRSPARRPARRSRSKGATSAPTANIAGSRARPRRGSGRTGSWRASSVRRRTSPSPRRRSSTSSARSMSGPPSWPGARRSSGRCSKRPWKSWFCWSRTGP